MKKSLVFLLLACQQVFSHGYTPCEDGMADIFPCDNINLLSRVHIEHMGGELGDTGSDIWGWTDPLSGKEYALVGLSYGTAFVDISSPSEPLFLGVLPTATRDSIWRDIKTYDNHAYIVSEAESHGVQVFDLTQLRDLQQIPQQFQATNRYNRVGSIHNIVINEDTGFAYLVGGRGEGNLECNQGLHVLDLSNPAEPEFAGCFADDGYTHDAQCVIYHGDDVQYLNKEICFNANEDTVTIVDMSNKQSPVMISRTGYSDAQYTHQGWLTEDHRYYLMNDEQDEQVFGHNTKTYIWDMFDLDSPQLIGFYNGPQPSIDHNIYIKGNYAFLSNYTSGLSIVDIKDIGQGLLQETASFDSFPNHNNNNFDGVWSNYPFFESGVVILSDDTYGLFVLEPKLCPVLEAPSGLNALANGDNNIQLNWNSGLETGDSYSVYRSEGGCAVDNFELIASNLTEGEFIDESVSGGVPVGYKVVINPDSNLECESQRSQCIETQTSGLCTVAPQFNGIKALNTDTLASCAMNLSWDSAQSYCGNPVLYDVFKSTNPEFEATEENRVASNIITENWTDTQVASGSSYYYMVRARDAVNGSQESNQLKLSDFSFGEVSEGHWFDGAEVNDKSQKVALKHVGWEFDSGESFEGQRSYWSQSESNLCNTLLTPQLKLSENNSSQLSFWTKHDLEFQYDGGVVEVLTDQSDWIQAELQPEYPNFFRNTNDACGYEFNTPIFTGTDNEWKKYTMDLSAYQGQEVQFQWNYSSNSETNGAGWYIDNIEVTNTLIAGQCETQDVSLQAGFWYDPSRSGHGFVVEPIGRDNLYFIVFYSYKADGTPEWFTSLATYEDGTLNLKMDANSLNRSIRDFDSNETVLDPEFSEGQIQINFNPNTALNTSACNDGVIRSENSATVQWKIGESSDQWCIQPLISNDNIGNPDIGGTWWAGASDSGWGLSLAVSQDLLVASVYFFDQSGEPRWVLGTSDNFAINQEITLEMSQFQGFPRDSQTSELKQLSAGNLTLQISSSNTDGEMSLDLEYQGTEGGVWQRQQIPIELFTQLHGND